MGSGSADSYRGMIDQAESRSVHIMTNPDGPKTFGSDGSRSGSDPQHSSKVSKCLVDRVEDV